ncbi:MAG: hypothetical protein IPN93_11740 [Bacteroidetes bacterium]|jgi:hypothetical protein|nr:hypothetical protein [Bacteroidota bacterium]MBK8673605.1 hypothetical protein [Bacteroidota bacterium]MBK9633242.1 hypothetical protein [Bacteroidota bacterium]MBL0078113.1 hypothetical protein [Bacteroidota bacterium]MBP7257839.1 hypothetical protein [Chitinophagales bacterium]
MKTYIKLLLVALMPYIFIACKKDLTPTKSNLMIGSIDYNFKILNSSNQNVFSNYDFEYSENKILKKTFLDGFLAYSFGFSSSFFYGGRGPFDFTTKYQGVKFELEKNMGLDDNINNNGEDQILVLDNSNKIKQSILKYGFNVPSFGWFIYEDINNFSYSNDKLTKITKISSSNNDSISDFNYEINKLTSFSYFLNASHSNNVINDSCTTYSLGYQNNSPDTSMVNVNGINNLILCIPFRVQETLPFLVVDDRLSLTGKKQNYLINSISIEEKRGGVSQKTTNYTINYLYDLEGRITQVQWINNATLAIYREAVIGYL